MTLRSVVVAIVIMGAACCGLPTPILAIESKPSDALPLAGHWVGDVPLEDGRTPKLAIDLDQMGSRWVGEFDVDAFGVQDYPVRVQLDGRRVTLGLSAAEAEFQGAIDGDRMSGAVDFDGRKIEVELRRTGHAEFSPSFLELEAAADDSTRVETLSEDGAELRARFNADRNKTRLLMLLAPT